jgi:SAM-dependent methyltransferase
MGKPNSKLFRDMAGVKLDLGCGSNKQPGFVGLDRFRSPGVDIVHDLQRFPWPVPSNSCSTVLLSGVWGFIEPKYSDRFMDELWRICRHDGQALISSPYAGTFLAQSVPGHYSCPTELTFGFYCPDWTSYNGRSRPWKIVRNDPNKVGNIEVILEPYKDERGRPNWKKSKRK